MNLPRIAITMGDPAGVGPELCLRALGDPIVGDVCVPIVFGDIVVIRHLSKLLDIPCNAQLNDEFYQDRSVSRPTIVSSSGDGVLGHKAAVINAATGQDSFNYVESAIAAARSGLVDAVVTGPINKEAWDAAGIGYPGHTELFAERFGSDNFCMMMTSPGLSCSLVTTHIGFADVIGQLTTERILDVIELSHEALKRMRGREPRIVVLGLNPHAGENGLFGNQEEESFIAPAIEAARSKGIDVTGPIPPDTAFLPSRLATTDCHVCMYHDQGLIPFKALAFDTGVNITLGLPTIRTSVDHGTALDIAWQGTADPSSMIAAIKLAAQLTSDS